MAIFPSAAPIPSAPEMPLDLPPGVELPPEIDLGMEPQAPILEADADGNIYEVAGDLEPPPPPFDANLAEFLTASQLSRIGADVVQMFEEDRDARREWERGCVDGLELLGLKHETRNEPWPGACGVTHPVMLEALIRFQATTMAETFPASGPCKAKVIGKITPERDQQAIRVRDHVNYHLTEVMPEYRSEHEKALWGTGLDGEAFKKVYRDPISGRATSRFVPASDLVRAYGSSDLETCPRYTHSTLVAGNDLKKMQASGFYLRDVQLDDPTEERTKVEEAVDEVKGFDVTSCPKGRHRLLEMTADFDIPGFEDPDGIALPYVVTVDYTSGKVLSIYRNWDENDPLRRKLIAFVLYTFVPGPDGFGLGYTHILGGLARMATSSIRQLTDAGTLANMQGGFRTKGLRIKDDEIRIRPGHWVPVDVPSGSIRETLLPLPYKEPSVVLYQLHEKAVEDARRLATTQDLPVGDGNAEAPVGTTMALLEQAKIPMTAVQSRLHASMRRELKLLVDLIKTDPPVYPYEVDGGGPDIKIADFDGRVDVLPVSDPNASSRAERAIRIQALQTMVQQAPGEFDIPEVLQESMGILGFPDANRFLKKKDEAKPLDPISENMNLMTGKPVKAAIEQDHDAHLQVHLALIQDPKIQQLFKDKPEAVGAAMAHVQEHAAFKYRAEIEKQLGSALPPPGEPLPPEIETMIARLAAQAASKLLQKDVAEHQAAEHAKTMQDPIYQQRQEELAIKRSQVEQKERDSIRDAVVDILGMLAKDAQNDEKILSAEQIAVAQMISKQIDSVRQAQAKASAQKAPANAE